jgi:pilus assembly protein CpaB
VTPRTMILIFAALLTAGGTIYFAQSWLSRERAQIEAMKKKPVKEEGDQILVAKKSLPAGLFVKPEDVEWRAWPKDGLAPTYYLKGTVEKTALIGAVVRRGIAAGEPIAEGKLAKPGDQGFLAAVLDPGMRAITVSINQTSGIAGFVFPGDRVDLLLTTEIADVDGSGQKRFASETVLTKIRVLAMDQRVNDIENTPKVSKTITVEVTPKQAEMIAVADRIGHLSLSLRSLARDEQPKDDKDAATATAAAATEDDLAVKSAENAKPAENTKPAEKAKPDVKVAADKDESRPPERGTSVTFDSEASRLVGPRSDTNQVIIIRGATAEAVKTNGGGSAGTGKSATKPATSGSTEESGTDEGASEGTGAGGSRTGTVVPQKSGSAGTGGVGSLGTSTTDLLKRGRL